MDEDRVARVLVVEDEADYREIVCEFLSGAGYDVVAVGDVASARAAILAQPPDIAVLDLQLPDGTGFDVAADLALSGAAHGAIPIIACSGDHDSLSRARSDRRFAGVYPKPSSLAEIVRAVGQALRGGNGAAQGI